MSTKTINATEAARNFSDVLNQVRYRETSFEVVRGRDVIARIVPAGRSTHGLPIRDLEALFAKLPRLNEDDIEAFERDIESTAAQAAYSEQAWD